MNVALNLLVIRVAELERARRFYEALGLQFTSERHGKGPEHLVAVLDGMVFEIYPRGNGPSSSGARLGFQVTSVHEAIASLEKLGAKIASPPTEGPWGFRAIAIDHDEHRVEIAEAKKDKS